VRREGDEPTKEFRSAVDFAMHGVVNKRLRELNRGGFATVHRTIYTPRLEELLEGFYLTAENVIEMVERASIDAAASYIEDLARDRHWFLHTLASINEETIDSLALSRFIDEHKADQLAAEAQALGAIVTDFAAADSPGESDDSERWPYSDTLNERVYDALMAAGKRALADEFAAANGGDHD
jgi:hypothetical protein